MRLCSLIILFCASRFDGKLTVKGYQNSFDCKTNTAPGVHRCAFRGPSPALQPSWRTSSRLVERRGARASGRNFLKLHAFIPNSQDAEAPHQNLAFGDGVNLVAIVKKSEARRADGHGAKAIELYVARQGQRRRRGWKLGT